MNLSILIPTLPKRKASFDTLVKEIERQIDKYDLHGLVKIIPNDSDILSIGGKRNELLNCVETEYFCFVDDDDEISHYYLDELFKAIRGGFDCCSLIGVITIDGGEPEIFEHSIKYSEYKTTGNQVKYERYPNHLNCVKSSIGKQFSFLPINHGEDTDWATQIFNSGLIKSEYNCNKVLYYYKFISQK